MEHSNPILMGNNSPQKFITIGGEDAAPDPAEL